MTNSIMILVIVAFLIAAQIIPQSLYYFRMKKLSEKSWNVKINPTYQPRVSILVPTYQEADIIEEKLHNLNSLIYPEDRLEVIIIDSASTDGTLEVCKKWLSNNAFKFKILLLSEPKRISKAHALNYALKYAKGEVIITNDADAILIPDILLKALPYLADPSIGAISGREIVKNDQECFLTKMESVYREMYYTLRLGESKLNSAQIFQGEFAAYKRESLCLFVDELGRADDNGTVTELLKKGKRCLFIPDAIFQDSLPCSLYDYLNIKVRRANQLQREFMLRLRLRFKRELDVPLEILLINMHVHCIMPILFITSIPLIVMLLAYLFQFIPLYLATIIILITLIAIHRLRYVIALYFISNIILLIALFMLIFKRKGAAWKPVRSSRKRYLLELKNIRAENTIK